MVGSALTGQGNLTSAGREWCKWLALVCMTLDHANKVLHLDAPWMTAAGRICWPLFAVVLVDNLAGRSPDTAWRAFRRLLLAGIVIQPLYAYAFGAWLPLNVLLAFALGIFVCRFDVWWVSLAALLVGGLYVESQWFGALLFLAASVWVKRGGDWKGWVILTLGVAGICLTNANGWSLLALPMIWLAQHVPGTVPRWRWLFLGYYVAHLGALVVIRAVI